MVNKLKDVTIYFDGKVINTNAKSIVTIGSTYHLKSEKDGIGETIALLPCDKVVIIFNNLIK